MAKATKKTGASAAVAKKVKPSETVKKISTEIEETKKIAAKPEAKKLMTAKEPEKIATAKEPKKITTAKEPKKIAAKPEPKKIAVKAEEDIEVKAVKKKTTVKKTTKTKVAVVEEDAKAVTLEEPKKATKTATKKTTAKKADAKPKTEAKPKTVKKATKKIDAEKIAAYEAYTLEECIAKVQEMGVHHTYQDYTRFLMDEKDLVALEKNIVDGNDLTNKAFSFKEQGFDHDLVLVTLKKVADTMDIKASDFAVIAADMNDCMNMTIGNDVEANSAAYLKEFKVCEKILMIAQRRDITTASDLSAIVGADVVAFAVHLFDLAYAILPTWQYDDVKFYEDFAYALLTQLTDLYTAHQLRILMDVADLYIKHGDFTHGDACYGYILRDNQIKDYIYYRFASVYENIDYNKAKSLAYESLQYVDGRYTYYQNIMDIINR